MKTFLISIALMFASFQAAAFPELTRHGYTQCTACHLSPSGGGVLTQYGRQLSEEVLSTWSYKGEGQFLHGALKSDPADKGFLFGGDVRAIQVHRKTSTVETGRFFLMQANLDVAYQHDKFAAMISVGQIEKPMSGRVQGNFDATKYYVMYNATDSLAIRAGRFYPQFGLNMPDHVLVTKQGIGFLPQLQYDTLEASMLTENWSLFAGVSRTIPETAINAKEKARHIHAMYNFAERFKVGVSHWYGEKESSIRRIYGLNSILGFTPHFYNLSEVNFANTSSSDGVFAMTRFGYELVRGLVPYIQYQHQHADLNTSRAVHHYTLGSHFFPRPHFEISGQWTKVHGVQEWSDEAYLLAHYYF